MASLKSPHDIADRDPLRRLCEDEAAISTALSGHEPGVGETADDFGQVVARDGKLACDLLGREYARRLARKPHEGAKTVVRERGEAHGRPSEIGIVNASYSRSNKHCKYEFEDDMSDDVRPGDAMERRADFAAGVRVRTGIDEDMIRYLVHGFYDKVRADTVLGPIFVARIEDWGPHLERMCAFWSSVALMTGRYHGRPMQKHAPLPVDAAHFDRWLALFVETAQEVCPPAAADLFIERAHMIAESLELGIATHRGLCLSKGERLPSTGQV